MTKQIVNVAASMRQRLLNIARAQKEDFGLVLTKYGLERVLYRISQSQYRNLFVLKGALLFELWSAQRYRPTRDADFLAKGENSPERVGALFKEICEMNVEDDGVHFDPSSVVAERITEDSNYEGIRVKFVGRLDTARISIQIDLGFGDVVTPAPIETEIPSLLDVPRARLLTYPRESVIAEKFEAMISLGMVNSRMKDLYDIMSLSRDFEFEGAQLSEAISKTFAKRQTDLPTDVPLVFTAEFYKDGDKVRQWSAFCDRNRAYIDEMSLELVCRAISSFLTPIIDGVNEKINIPNIWARGKWS